MENNHQQGSNSRGYVEESFNRAWDEAMHEVRAQTVDHQLPSAKWFRELPDINKWYLGSGTACIMLGFFCLIGVPILLYMNATAQAAIYPYTEAGKRESCLGNLKQIALAVQQYRQDYDDRYPIPECVARNATTPARMTWVAQVQPYIGRPLLPCPTRYRGQSDGTMISSYGINPILCGQANTGIQKPEETLLFADRDEAHDTVLFPPFASWPVAHNTKDVTYDAANVSYRHSEGGPHTQAAVVYADGHADTITPGQVATDVTPWGGMLVWNASQERLENQYPILTKITSAPPKSFEGQRANLRTALVQLRVLEIQTQTNRYFHEDIEKHLWRGAGILASFGEGFVEKQLYADLHGYSQALLKEVGQDWKKHESSFGFNVHYPNGWTNSLETEGRYRTTYFRSPSKYIEALVEYGERNEPTNATTIDWIGMEASLKERYGKNYKRIQMSYETLGGQTVSVWECFLKKPDGPRLRKIYFGRSTMWNSTILVCVAPAGDYKDWRSTFEQVQNGFEFRH